MFIWKSSDLISSEIVHCDHYLSIISTLIMFVFFNYILFRSAIIFQIFNVLKYSLLIDEFCASFYIQKDFLFKNVHF